MCVCVLHIFFKTNVKLKYHFAKLMTDITIISLK